MARVESPEETVGVPIDQAGRDPSARARTCVGCREVGDPTTMIRFVRDPEGLTQIDLRHRCPGRGVYLHPRRRCLQQALHRKSLQKALGSRIDSGDPEEWMERMRTALMVRFQERLSLARRAGAVVSGIEMVRRTMAENLALLVFVASDSSEGTARQVSSNAMRKGLPTIDWIDGRQLACAVGLEYLSALAVTREPFASDLEVLCTPLTKEPESSRGVHE
ncbi:MAG: DUF448 domain-containing protein [Bradymonadales bacterium]|nr:DUF448 domain-containing protein [Bradymonadales bacterium]